jgi:hypothetical protein
LLNKKEESWHNKQQKAGNKTQLDYLEMKTRMSIGVFMRKSIKLSFPEGLVLPFSSFQDVFANNHFLFFLEYVLENTFKILRKY